MACIGTAEDYKSDLKIGGLIYYENFPPNTHDVDFDENPLELKSKGFKNAGVDSYVISSADSFDKYSGRFADCTGVVVVGRDKITGENISFLSHQNPDYFLILPDYFTRDFRERINEIKERCEPGTLDAVIFGGRYAKVREFNDSDPNSDMFIEDYKKSINFLAKEVKDLLGFESAVIAGPKTEPFPGGDKVFYDNEHRKIYLIREKIQSDSAQGFMPSEIEKRRKDWKPGKWSLPI